MTDEVKPDAEEAPELIEASAEISGLTVVVDPSGAPDKVVVTLEHGSVILSAFSYSHQDDVVARVANGCKQNRVTDLRVWMTGKGPALADGLEAKGFKVLRLQP